MLMAKNEEYIFLGTVTDVGPTHCTVVLEVPGSPVVRAYIAGKMRNRYNIVIVKGDRVKVELEPTDVTQGRIIYREDKKTQHNTGHNK